MKKTKAITPARPMVDVSPQEMRRRSAPFETNTQVKARYEAEEKAQRKLVSAKGRVTELDEIERRGNKNPTNAFLTGLSVIKERPKATSDLKKARAEAERYSPYSTGSAKASTTKRPK